MGSPLIISVSGLRGDIGGSLTPEVVVRYGTAFAMSLPPGPVLLSRDGRRSGELFADLLAATLCALGRDVLDCGVAATPTVGVLVRSLACVGGIQISASHNPKPYNGLKLFSSAGRVIPKGEGERVLEIYRGLESQNLSPSYVAVDQLGGRKRVADTISAHSAAVLATVDVEAIRAARFRVLLDANHGAGALLGSPLLEALGCDVTRLGAEPNGEFSHEAEPTAENLAPILDTVRQARVDVAFCQDPDADRLALIDETGRYIGEEYTLALCAKQKLTQCQAAKKPLGPIVINGATSRMTIDVAESFGVPCFRSAVGEANVVDRMLAEQALFGGEGNGGPIDPAVGLVRDSFVGMATILDLMAAGSVRLSQLADELPRYAILKRKITLAGEKIPTALNGLAKKYADHHPDRSDGVRIDFASSWGLIRASNTEPIVRVIVEAPSESEAEALAQRLEADLETESQNG